MIRKALKQNWKGILAGIIIAALIYPIVTYVNGWLEFRRVQEQNTRIIAAYLQNDNPKLLQRILSPAPQQPAENKQPQPAPVTTPQPTEPGQEAIK